MSRILRLSWVLAFLFGAVAPTSAAATVWSVEVKCVGLWDVIVDLLQDSVKVGTATFVCEDQKVRTEIDVMTGVVNDGGLSAFSDSAVCQHFAPGGTDLAKLEMECEGKSEDLGENETEQKIEIEVELREDRDEEESDDD